MTIQSILNRLGPARPQQHTFAEAFGRALSGGHAVWTGRAGTGVGKTFGYLVPALLDGRKAVVSVYTLSLLRQVEVDAAAVAEAIATETGRRPVVVRRLGMRNFLSPVRIRQALAEAEPPEISAALRQIQAFAEDDAESGLWQDWVDRFGELPEGLRPADICLLPSCPTKEKAKWAAQSEAAEGADLVLQTHASTFLQALRGDAPGEIVIIDEADRMLDAAASFEDRVDSEDLVRLAEVLVLPGLADLIEEAREAIENREVAMSAADPTVQRLVEAMRHELSTVRTDDLGLRSEIADVMRGLASAGNSAPENIYAGAALIRTNLGFAIRTVRAEPARGVSRLWRGDGAAKTVALVSATLDDAAKRGLGLLPGEDSPDRIEVDADRNFGQLRFRLADRALIEPLAAEGGLNDEFARYVAYAIGEARKGGGRTLVLVPAFSDVESLEPLLPADTLLHRRGQRLAPLIEAYRGGNAESVLVTPAAWEGISLPGMVQNLVVVRVPFPPPDRARQQVLQRVLDERRSGGDAARILLSAGRAAARRKLTQGIGRAIRQSGDKATIWLLDPRFPLPDALVADRRMRLTQGLAVGNSDLRSAIPSRFRDGIGAAYTTAKVLERPVCNVAGAGLLL